MRLAGLVLFAALLPGASAIAAQDRPAAPQAAASEAVAPEPVAADPAPRACKSAFTADGANFDAAGAFEACRRAAAAGDAASLQRLGMLRLAGIGTPKDLAGAATACDDAGKAQSGAPEIGVGAGFCLAAITRERIAAGELAARPAPVAPAPESAAAKTIDEWRDRAERGDRTGTNRLCDTYFEAGPATFDPAKAAEWCRRATGYGDPRAMQRMGLMRIWGVGGDRGGQQAQALCSEAQRRDPAVSASFCVAAVRQEGVRAAERASPSRSSYPQPWPASTDPGLLASALAADRVMESVHGPNDGPHFNCRELIRWSRYGPGVDTSAFGRPILQYRDEDFAALDAGAASCMADIAPYDPDGAERAYLAEFRRTLPSLRARKRELTQAAATDRSDHARYSTLNAQRTFSVMDGFLSPQQRRCVDAIRHDWTSRSFDPGAQAIEIRTAGTDVVNGSTVVSGSARVIEDPLENRVTSNTYSCTFDGRSQVIVDKWIAPESGPALPALPQQ